MAGIDAEAVGQLGEAAEAVEEPLRALDSADGQIRSRSVADEQRVSGQYHLVADGECAVLRTVPRGVDHADRHGADRDLLAVGERVVRVLRLRERVHGDRHTLLKREPPVP